MGFQDTIIKRRAIILKLLQRHNELSTTRISSVTGLNYYVVKDVLNDLLQGKRVNKRLNGNWSYWSLNKNVGKQDISKKD